MDREYVNIRVHVLGELQEEMQYLGAIDLVDLPIQSLVMVCGVCGKRMASLFTRIQGRTNPRFDVRIVRCSECDGDDTILYSGFYGSVLGRAGTFPLKFLAYEIDALLNKGDKDLYDHPAYGERK